MILVLITLAIIFGQLSLVAFGGGNSILPEMQRQLVSVHHFLTAEEFSAMFALAHAAPGPNMMIVPLVGWHIAGPYGLLVASAANFGPSCLFTGYVLHMWERFRARPWRRVVQAGILPITSGLIAASAAIITQSAVQSWPLALVTAITALVMMTTRLHPLYLLAAGGAFGLTGIGQG